MKDNKELGYRGNVIEIDLVELWHELKGNMALIGGVTTAFVAAAAVYSYMVLKPVYGYSALLRVPNYNATLQNTCVEMLKGDLGQGGLSGVSLTKGSAVIKLSFTGADPEKLTDNVKAYLPKAVEKVQKIVDEQDMQRLGWSNINDINNNIKEVKNQLQLVNGENKSQGLLRDLDINSVRKSLENLDILKKHLEEKDAKLLTLKVELSAPEKASNVPISPNKKKNISLAFVAGLFLSCGWVVAKYVFRKSREGK